MAQTYYGICGIRVWWGEKKFCFSRVYTSLELIIFSSNLHTVLVSDMGRKLFFCSGDFPGFKNGIKFDCRQISGKTFSVKTLLKMCKRSVVALSERFFNIW